MLEIRTRYAPSPTGPLNLGGARTALFNLLFAKKDAGTFILRIEDTDKARSEKKYEDNIINGLKWLGIEWDELHRQSERIEIYGKYLKKLLDGGHAYLSKESEGERSEVIRFKNPNCSLEFNDLIRGRIEFDTSALGDFVVAKSLVEPLYHLAVVVDDEEMKISHVIRGEDHISNTPRQILLAEALGFLKPIYAHLPLILGPDRSKLSKRHGAESIEEYKRLGYLPEALLNYSALLGWHPAQEQSQASQASQLARSKSVEREVFSKEELIQLFSIDRAQKGGAVFDIQKLDWMNGEYIRRKTPRELLELCKPFLELLSLDRLPIEKIIALEQPRLKKMSELPEKISYFSKEPDYEKDLLKWKKMTDQEILQSLKKSEEIIRSVPDADFKKDVIESVFLKMIGEGDKGIILWPFRAALSGKKASPGPFEISEILGKAETLKRLNYAQRLFQD